MALMEPEYPDLSRLFFDIDEEFLEGMVLSTEGIFSKEFYEQLTEFHETFLGFE
jgi:hypothetical protein